MACFSGHVAEFTNESKTGRTDRSLYYVIQTMLGRVCVLLSTFKCTINANGFWLLTLQNNNKVISFIRDQLDLRRHEEAEWKLKPIN